MLFKYPSLLETATWISKMAGLNERQMDKWTNPQSIVGQSGTFTLTSRVNLESPNMHVLGWWMEDGIPRENMQTPHRKAPAEI